MSFIDILGGINCGLVFFFGASLSVVIAGGCRSQRDWCLLFMLCPIFLALQTMSWLLLGLDTTKQLYPLLIHLPLLLMLIFGLKRRAGVSLVSVFAAYLCCQYPRCCAITAGIITGSGLAGQVVYTTCIVPIFLFLLRYFVPSARDIMAESPRALFLLGTLPVIYYVYDYTIALYTSLHYTDLLSYDLNYSGREVVAEMLPTVVGLLYMLYSTAYRQQLQLKSQAELLNSLMTGQLKQAEAEIASLRQADAQSAVYRHDMRHHMAAINAFLTEDKPKQAEEYIKQVQADIEAITPKRFCQNELVNLLCASFANQAERRGIRLTVEAGLPENVSFSDTELCAMISNGLENALNAVSELEEPQRWVSFSCGIQMKKLLIEIKNPYRGQVMFRDGLPVSGREGHGHGCRSIRTIASRSQGLCQFKAEDGIFFLRIVLSI